MKLTTTISIVLAALTMAACGNNKKAEEPEKSIGLQTKIDGDSTLY